MFAIALIFLGYYIGSFAAMICINIIQEEEFVNELRDLKNLDWRGWVALIIAPIMMLFFTYKIARSRRQDAAKMNAYREQRGKSD